jgi:hypothetical protein
MSILETLRARFAERARTADETLTDAARRVAAGESVDMAAVESALTALQKSVGDFEAMIELARRRQGWYSAMNGLAAATARKSKAMAAAAAERAAFERVAEAWQARGRELDAEIEAADKVIQAASTARENLTNHRNVPGQLGEKLADAQTALEKATAATNRLRRAALEAANESKSERGFAEHKRTYNISTPAGDADDHERKAKRLERRAAELQAETAAAAAAEKDAEAELKRLQEAAMKI